MVLTRRNKYRRMRENSVWKTRRDFRQLKMNLIKDITCRTESERRARGMHLKAESLCGRSIPRETF